METLQLLPARRAELRTFHHQASSGRWSRRPGSADHGGIPMRRLGVSRAVVGSLPHVRDRHLQTVAPWTVGIGRDAIAAAFVLGAALRICGHSGPAVGFLEFAAQGRRESGDVLGEANARSYLGAVLRLEGDTERSRAPLTRARGLYQDFASRTGDADVLVNLGLALDRMGLTAEAGKSIRKAAELFESLGNQHAAAAAWIELGVLARRDESAESAKSVFARALRISEGTGCRPGQVNALLEMNDPQGEGRSISWRPPLPAAIVGLRPGVDLRTAIELAEETVDLALAVAEPLGVIGPKTWILRHHTALLAAAGERQLAGSRFRELTRSARSDGSPCEERGAWGILDADPE